MYLKIILILLYTTGFITTRGCNPDECEYLCCDKFDHCAIFEDECVTYSENYKIPV